MGIGNKEKHTEKEAKTEGQISNYQHSGTVVLSE